MRVLYYMEKELANFDPTRAGPANGRFENSKSDMGEIHQAKCIRILVPILAKTGLCLGRPF